MKVAHTLSCGIANCGFVTPATDNHHLDGEYSRHEVALLAHFYLVNHSWIILDNRSDLK